MKGAIKAGDRFIVARQEPQSSRWGVWVIDEYGDEQPFGEYPSEATALAAQQEAIGSYQIPPATIPR